MDTISSTVEPTAQREAIMRTGRAVLKAEAAAIQDALGRLDDRFGEAVKAILDCRGRVCVTGVGKAGLIGHKIQATLASTGTLAYSLHPVEALHGDLGMVDAQDIVLGLSKSGGSELVALLPRLKQLGCRSILLTANPDSPAAQHADMVLHIGTTPEACPLGLAPSSSTAAMLALGDALALTVMELKSIRPEQYASYHPGGALGRFLMRAHEIMRTGENCPTVRARATLGDCYEAILNAPRRAGAAAIVDDEGLLVGIVTHGDFFRLFKGHDGAGACDSDRAVDRAVSEVMSRDPKHIAENDRAVDAIELMQRYSIDELPVVDAGNRLVGMIDVQDLIARGFSVTEGS